MAYNANNEICEELVNIKKGNRGDCIIASKITNKNTNNVSIDIRQYYTDDEGELKPTSKGVRFNSELLSDLLGGLAIALETNEMLDLSDKLEDIVGAEDDLDTPE